MKKAKKKHKDNRSYSVVHFRVECERMSVNVSCIRSFSFGRLLVVVNCISLLTSDKTK